MTVGDFSVLLPVYAGDQPEFFFRAVSSATREQELSPKQLVVVCDGPVDESISDFLHRASRGQETDLLGPINVRVVRLKHNMGLANALNIGLAHCSHEIVARVDADDISLPQRFAIQIPLISVTTRPRLGLCAPCQPAKKRSVGSFPIVRLSRTPQLCTARARSRQLGDMSISN